jgi:hypothetical protein
MMILLGWYADGLIVYSLFPAEFPDSESSETAC